jgi:fatty-acyl-CoA synthase
MQDHPLLISSLIEFAERHHGDRAIVSRRVEGDIHRYSWADAARRSCQVAHAVEAEGVPFSGRVATLAWNGYRHLELYYGVSGAGRVVHTINPRLHPGQLIWIVNHAEDQVLCFETSFLPLVQAIHTHCPTVRRWVLLCDADKLPHDSGIPNLVSYEAWIGAQSDRYTWPRFDENSAAGMCYTSGTTGDPKAVLYSHRSTILHAYGVALPDVTGLSACDVMLPVVPMFHVNAWGTPYAAALVGASLVFPGPALDGKSLYELIEAEKVTITAGVPTIWQMLLAHVSANKLRFSRLARLLIGGSAAPLAMIETFENDYGVKAIHAWGMTETSPLGTAWAPKAKHMDLSAQQCQPLKVKQGRAIFGVDLKIIDDQGHDVPWDGKTYGDLLIKGPWILRAYYKGQGSPLIRDEHALGWFPTGDVATIDADGYMQITDRSKDVIKSGGEWISSIDIENIAVAHPAVAMAACVGVPHPKWDERPVLLVVKRAGIEVSREELLRFYEDKIAKWQIPDDVIFMDSIALGATGKILKTKLREQLKDYKLPGV